MRVDEDRVAGLSRRRSARERSRRTRRVGEMLGMVLMMAAAGCGHGAPSAAGGGPKVSEDLSTITVAGVGLAAPQAVVHDAAADVYLVSNDDGGASGGQGSGFITRLAPNGDVEALRWIDGARPGVTLRAPSGMALRGDTLYVADVDCVRLFDRVTAAPAGSVCPGGATSLEDVTVDPDGLVYVTDPGRAGGAADSTAAGAVYVIDREGAATVAADAQGLEGPRGIAAGDRGVFVATAAGGRVAQLTPDGPRSVLHGSSWTLSGIAFTRAGGILFANEADSTVLYVRAQQGGSRGQLFTLARDVPNPGLLGYDARRDRVLVPMVSEDRLVFVDLGG